MTKGEDPTFSDEAWWFEWLDARFGYANYLTLTRPFKEQHFHNCAREIVLALEIKNKGRECTDRIEKVIHQVEEKV